MAFSTSERPDSSREDGSGEGPVNVLDALRSDLGLPALAGGSLARLRITEKGCRIEARFAWSGVTYLRLRALPLLIARREIVLMTERQYSVLLALRGKHRAAKRPGVAQTAGALALAVGVAAGLLWRRAWGTLGGNDEAWPAPGRARRLVEESKEALEGRAEASEEADEEASAPGAGGLDEASRRASRLAFAGHAGQRVEPYRVRLIRRHRALGGADVTCEAACYEN